MNDNHELYHYGVVGMKWGVRRAARRDNKVRQAKRHMDADGRAANEAMNRYANTIVGKKRRDAAKKNAVESLGQYEKSRNAYKKAYKTAANKATKDMVAKGYHEGAVKRINKQSSGKTVAQTMLLGSYGAMKYNQARSEGATRGKAATAAVLSSWANNMTLGSLGAMERRNRRRPMDEKPHKNRSWDEKPHKENTGRI